MQQKLSNLPPGTTKPLVMKWRDATDQETQVSDHFRYNLTQALVKTLSV